MSRAAELLEAQSKLLTIQDRLLEEYRKAADQDKTIIELLKEKIEILERMKGVS